MMGAQVPNMPCGRWPDIGPVRGALKTLPFYIITACVQESKKKFGKENLKFS